MSNEKTGSSYHKQEKQKEQSKKWLCDALIMLMKNNSFQDITITQICQEADLSRRTFYRLFSSKESLIVYHIQMLCESYSHLFDCESDRRLPNVSFLFFDFWGHHKDFLLLLKENHLESLLFETFSSMLPQIYMYPNCKPIETSNQTIRYYMAIFCAGGYAMLLLKWIENDCCETKEFMKRVMEELVKMNAK